jgi:hypothetical protein
MSSQATNQSAEQVIAKDEQFQPILLFGTGVPSNGIKGIRGGALYIRLHESTSGIYQNTGTIASTTWTAITVP